MAGALRIRQRIHFSKTPDASFRGVRSTSPESITTIVSMDSGPAPSGASRNDGHMPSRSRRAFRASFALQLHALENRGRRECRMRAAPAVSCAMVVKSAHTSIQGSGGNPTFPAQWLYGLYVLSPVSRSSLATVVPEKLISPELDASISGVRTTRLRRTLSRRSLSALPASTAARPTFVAIMKRPSERNGMRVICADLGFVKTEIFLIPGLDTIYGNQK